MANAKSINHIRKMCSRNGFWLDTAYRAQAAGAACHERAGFRFRPVNYFSFKRQSITIVMRTALNGKPPVGTLYTTVHRLECRDRDT